MTFWYFSRSHFPKSQSLGTVFKFSASTINSEDSNQRSLLVVVLSFMFTSELESQCYPVQSWVELPSKGRLFWTCRLITEYGSLCMCITMDKRETVVRGPQGGLA